MTRRGTQPETILRLAIFHAVGSDPSLLVLRNAIGKDRETHVVYGLGTGSPDLVAILAPWGHLLGLEVKCPGEYPDPDQRVNHALWRRKGATVYVVRSVEEAVRAVAETRAALAMRWGLDEHFAVATTTTNVPTPDNIRPIRKARKT